MPMPGQANNALGINSFSGPMGSKEPAYGDIERLKTLTALAPPGTPAAVGAPKRSKRAAMKGKTTSAVQEAPVTPANSPVPTQAPYAQQLTEFWQQIASEPEASDLVKQYAQKVLGGQG